MVRIEACTAATGLPTDLLLPTGRAAPAAVGHTWQHLGLDEKRVESCGELSVCNCTGTCDIRK